MRQALAVGARPLFARGKVFPRTPLGKGGWRIVTEYVETTKIRLHTFRKEVKDDGVFTVPGVIEMNGEGSIPLLDGPIEVAVEFFEAGREPVVNVFAEAIHVGT